MIKKCLVCYKEFYTKPSRIKIGKGKFCSKNCFDMDQRENPRNYEENSYQWKGDKAGYNAKHRWIYKHYGKALICSINLSHKSYRFEWANISGEYLRDIRDWRQLCIKCHRKIDKLSEKTKLNWEKGVYDNRKRLNH